MKTSWRCSMFTHVSWISSLAAPPSNIIHSFIHSSYDIQRRQDVMSAAQHALEVMELTAESQAQKAQQQAMLAAAAGSAEAHGRLFSPPQ